jgi:hypothetical protein
LSRSAHDRRGAHPQTFQPSASAATAIFVLGMHRSGTSATTRVVNLLGVPTVAGDDLLPPARLNPTGFWESASLNNLNDEILRRFGGDSGKPPQFAAGWELDPRLAGLHVRAERCLRETFPTGEWIWKDPRNCLTLPFWRRISTARAVALIVYRNPLEVAASLLAHHAVPKRAALRLWERYLRDALLHASDLPSFVVDYSDLVADPALAAANLHGFLTYCGMRLPPLDGDSQDVASFVTDTLRHYRADPAELVRDRDVTAAQRRLYAWLGASRGAHPRLQAPRSR